MNNPLKKFQRLLSTNVLWEFPFIYLGWAFLFWSPLFGSELSVWSFPNILFFLVGGASPLLAAIVLAALTGGREQLIDLWRRLIDIQRIRLLWWVAILFFWLVFNLIMAGIAVVLGVTDRPLDIAWHLFTEPGMLAFLLVLSFVFPAVEEVGLRGYYLDALQKRFSTTVASLINGGVWAIWHAPFVWFPGYYANTTFHPSLYWWLPMIVFTTLLIVQVYNHTQRSILAVLIFHGMMNFTGELLGISAEMYPFVLSGYAMLAMLLLLQWRSGTAPK
jgi:uncharacterized protein